MSKTYRVWFKTVTLTAVFLCAAAVGPLTATAMPVDVSYTVTGSTGDWTLDFSFTNNLSPAPATMGLPYLGVQLSTHDIVGSPAGYFDQNQLVNFAPQGGSSTIYNNIWYNNDLNNTLFPGSTLSGFLVHVTDVAAPTTVSWFAFGYDNGFHGSYTGGGNFYTNTNPGFEGVAAVPLPAAAVLFGSGLVGIVGWLQKQKARAGLSNRSSVIRL